jgi:uncharacterized protein
MICKSLASTAILALLVACGGSVALGGAATGAGVSASTDSYREEIEKWHRGRIDRLKADDGWLTLVGLFPLPPGIHRFGSAADNEMVFPASTPPHAGTIQVDPAGHATLTAVDGVVMTHDGAAVTTLALESDKDGHPSEIQLGNVRFYVIDRPGSLYLRVKDADSPVRANFKDIDRFPVSRAWRLDARLDPYDPPHKVKIPNVLGFDEVVDCPGALVFQVDGKEYRLEPMSQEGDEWFVVFADATTGHETYGGGRFVYVPVAGPDGKTVIDFNKAYNPPCVFTEFATCPLPHPQNVLPFRVDAGEKMWGTGHHRPHE